MQQWKYCHGFIKEVRLLTMKWITRGRPKIDRLAYPWLIKRFIDPDAEILYLPCAPETSRPL